MNLQPHEIVSIVCGYFELEPEKIFKPTRKREIVSKRQILHFILKKHTKLTLVEIGKIQMSYGISKHQDHATILHSCNVISGLIDVNRRVRIKISEIDEEIRFYFLKYSENRIIPRKINLLQIAINNTKILQNYI